MDRENRVEIRERMGRIPNLETRSALNTLARTVVELLDEVCPRPEPEIAAAEVAERMSNLGEQRRGVEFGFVEPKTYSVYVICENCGNSATIEPVKGESIDVTPCPRCQVVGYLDRRGRRPEINPWQQAALFWIRMPQETIYVHHRTDWVVTVESDIGPGRTGSGKALSDAFMRARVLDTTLMGLAVRAERER